MNPKLTLDEIVQKHVESLGGQQAVAAAKTRVLIGAATLSKMGESDKTVSKLSGTAQFATSNGRLLFAILYQSQALPFEKFAFDGDTISIGKPISVPTELIGIPKNQAWIIKDGLFGGPLSANWPLLRYGEVRNRLDLAGTSKILSKSCYRIKYVPTTSDRSPVTFYIDTETFQLLRSEYIYVYQEFFKIPNMGTLSAGSDVIMTEDFSDYGKVGNLMLPHTQSIAITFGEGPSSDKTQWLIRYEQFYFDETLDSAAFRV